MKRESSLIDISRVIHPGMAVYPNNPPVGLDRQGKPDSVVTEIKFGSHTGTHIDAPSHIGLSDEGTDSYDLNLMNGPVEVVLIENLAEAKSERVLVKTKNSEGEMDVFDENFVALNEEQAEMLVGKGIKLVGIDALSIKKRGVKDRVHEILLAAGVVILEGLWLKDVPAGRYELICLPLRLKDLDGAPARVILRR